MFVCKIGLFQFSVSVRLFVKIVQLKLNSWTLTKTTSFYVCSFFFFRFLPMDDGPISKPNPSLTPLCLTLLSHSSLFTFISKPYPSHTLTSIDFLLPLAELKLLTLTSHSGWLWLIANCQTRLLTLTMLDCHLLNSPLATWLDIDCQSLDSPPLTRLCRSGRLRV